MKKRFTDVDIWKKRWFRLLPPAMKCAWRFITDNCDNAGVWDADREAAEFYIGEPIDWEDLLEALNGNIEVLDNGKWWLVDFCFFQYGELRDTCNPHKQVLQLLSKHGLELRVGQGLIKGSLTLKDKDKDKDKEEDKDKKVKHEKYGVPMNATRYENLCDEYGTSVVDTYVEKAVNYIESKGKKPYADYAAAAAQYMKRDNVKPSPRCDNDIPDFIRSEYD